MQAPQIHFSSFTPFIIMHKRDLQNLTKNYSLTKIAKFEKIRAFCQNRWIPKKKNGRSNRTWFKASWSTVQV